MGRLHGTTAVQATLFSSLFVNDIEGAAQAGGGRGPQLVGDAGDALVNDKNQVDIIRNKQKQVVYGAAHLSI